MEIKMKRNREEAFEGGVGKRLRTKVELEIAVESAVEAVRNGHPEALNAIAPQLAIFSKEDLYEIFVKICNFYSIWNILNPIIFFVK